jgi:hypothetical protein
MQNRRIDHLHSVIMCFCQAFIIAAYSGTITRSGDRAYSGRPIASSSRYGDWCQDAYRDRVFATLNDRINRCRAKIRFESLGAAEKQ